MQVNCLHPRIILNPLSNELISQYGNYTLLNKLYRVPYKKRLIYDFEVKNLNPKRLSITREDLDSCFITDWTTGELYPLYLEVPCGHCEICKESKVNSFVHRCKLETQLYNCKPIFLTLTYDEEHKKETGVNLRDCQLFFKRLRINLFRRGYREKIRYVLVSEYGRNTHRPHYHAIIWNLHASDFCSFSEIRRIIEKSWSQGFIMSRFIDPSNDSSFYYTSKYLRKDCYVPKGCSKPFLLSSRRNGGIGKPYFRSFSSSIINKRNIKPLFYNKFMGKSEPVQLCRYVINSILPSFCRSLPVRLKSSLRDYILSACILKYYYNYSDYYEKAKIYSDFFGKYFYCPLFSKNELKKMLVRSFQFHVRTCHFNEDRISRAFALGDSYYRRCQSLQRLRDCYLEKLFRFVEPNDLEHRAYNIRRNAALSAQREVL